MTTGTQQFDALFLKILTEICQVIIEITEQSMAEIKIAAQCVLPPDAADAFQQFRDLYFGESTATQYQVNKEVDDLFDTIQNDMANGIESTAAQETSKAAQQRIGVALLQKQLESSLTLDAEMRNKILPFISSLEFALGIRGKLDEIIALWATHFNNTLGAGVGTMIATLISQSKSLLQECVNDAEKPIAQIVALIQTLSADIERVSKTSKETKSVIHTLTVKSLNTKSLKVLSDALKSNPGHDLSVKLLPILKGLQFQDRTKQQMNNLTRMMALWQDWRQRPECESCADQPDFVLQFGASLVACTTTVEEFEAIHECIPQTKPNVSMQTDEGFFL